MTRRRVLVWGGLAVLVVGTLAWAAWPSSGATTPASRASELATELRCPDCEALSVADSDSTSAEAIRADLLRRTKAGESDAEIRQVRDNAVRSLATFDLPEPIDPADAANPWRWDPAWTNAAWIT